MQKLQAFISNFVFVLLVLLGFLLIFESQVVIPYWLQPFGRMHPMLLHFPIAFILVMVLLDLFKSHLDQVSYRKVHAMALSLTVLTTALSALMGFMLSKEEGYTSELMDLHKWVGVTVTYLIFILMMVNPEKLPYKFLLYGSFVILFFAGHFGAGLTHGMDFLLEPITSAKPLEVTEDTPVFQAFIDPILEEKCKSCHNRQKHKGELDMTTYQLLMEGGEYGPVVEPGNSLESEMIHRALLPMAMEEHMPPEGKPQLTDFELELLSAWIDAGADSLVSLSQLDTNDTLYQLASLRFEELQQSAAPGYSFDFASEKLLASLNNPYRSVIQETPESPALNVNLYVRQAYQKENLEELNKIKDQIVHLNLSYMPIVDDDLRLIGGFQNLEVLNLNYTDITSQGLDYLNGCKNLRSLAVSATGVDSQIIDKLNGLESLRELFIWNTKLSHQQIEDLKQRRPDLAVDAGYTADQDDPIQLTSPQLKNRSTVLAEDQPVMLEHKLNGVVIRYTTDNSDPDSLSSPLYTGPIPVHGFTRVKAVAYKDQWLTSDTAEYQVFSYGKTPVQVQLLTQPDPEYLGNGALSLTDKQKGTVSNFKGKEWLGFREVPFSALVDFGEDPPEINQVILSYGVKQSSHLMSPASVKIWGGEDSQDLRLLVTQSPPADEKGTPDREEVVQIETGPQKFRYYKIEGQPLGKLPAWHNDKGKPAWLFVDELFFY